LQPNGWIAAGLVVAFLSGLMPYGIYVSTRRAFNPVQENSITRERNGTSSVAIGALSGGITGLVYELAIRNK
jgi:hypothetical protein